MDIFDSYFKGVKGTKTAKIVSYIPKQTEKDLQTQVCKWIALAYPDVIFFSDFAAGLKLTMGQAQIRKMQSCKGKYLDLTILHPAYGSHGLIIELKVNEDDLFLVDGMTLKSDHVREQYDMICRLRSKGYSSDFGVGFNDITDIIRKYMHGVLEYKTIIKSRGL